MRLDVFLKKVGIFKSRTLAKEACEKGMISVNEKSVKPKYSVKIGDKVSIKLPRKFLKIEIVNLPLKQVKKKDCLRFYKILNLEKIEEKLEDDFWESL